MIFLQDQSNAVMSSMRSLEHFAKRLVGLDVIVSNAPIRYTSNGTKYFIYQCTRYVYNPSIDMFTPHQFHLGDTHAELALLTQGLTSQEAMLREELIGPNFIQVHVPNFFMAMLREFSSFFYIYQFTVLWLFYYLDYCK